VRVGCVRLRLGCFDSSMWTVSKALADRKMAVSMLNEIAEGKGLTGGQGGDMEMNDLADRLFDAKVGVVENDQAIDDTMAGLSRL
jgi:hypothetical protein